MFRVLGFGFLCKLYIWAVSWGTSGENKIYIEMHQRCGCRVVGRIIGVGVQGRGFEGLSV